MLTLSRKQRLRTLENDIRKAAGEIQKNGLQIGRDLCEIRDDELWTDEYDSWNQYLKERAHELVGKSFAQSAYLMRAAEVAKRLPDSINVNTNLAPAHLTELARLAPDKGKETRGKEKDYSRLRKQDVARVLKEATKNAGGKEPSVRDIRKAVDHDLGIDRSAKAKATREERDSGIKLSDYIHGKIGQIQGIIENLSQIPADTWELLEESEPGLAERLAEVCEDLAEMMRS